jgi:CubicO group peptidase (beta-lactamase class C family)
MRNVANPLVFLTILTALAAAGGCSRQTAAMPSSDRIDRLFAEWSKAGAPGCSVGVSRNGGITYQRGYGIANLDLAVPLSPASILSAASISKQFTAFSTLLLSHRHQVSLDDDVGKYVPGWVDHGARITIRQLLSHTSGLRDAFVLQGLRPEHPENINQQIVSILAHARGLNFAPGSQFEYNNGAYTLLAAIVERITGQKFSAFVDASIFKPLGMAHSYIHDDAARIIPSRAMPYARAPNGFRVALHTYTNEVVGNDGLYTTVGDLLRWEQNLADGGVGGAGLVREMQTPVIATGWPDMSDYGFGLEIAHHRGFLTVGHGGGDEGVSSYVLRYPDRRLAIAVLCNRDDVDAAAIVRSIAEIELEGAFPEPAKNAVSGAPVVKAISVPPRDLEAKVGLYRSMSDGSIGRVFLRGGKLIASGNDGAEYELTPIAPNRFAIMGTSAVVEFVPPTAGKPQKLRVTMAPGATPFLSQLVARTFAPSKADLRAFEGIYTSDEVEGTYTIVQSESGLLLRVPTRADTEFAPVLPDTFSSRTLGNVKFSRDASGRVTAFTATAAGIRGLRFERQSVAIPGLTDRAAVLIDRLTRTER